MTFKNNLFTCKILNRIFKQNVRYSSFHKPFKVLFFGSDSIALSSLRKINELRKSSKLIKTLDLVTANQTKHNSIIEKYALPENINIIRWPIQNLQPGEYDIGLIVAFGHMIKKDLLEKFPLGMVNVHPSLLPRWRGAAPIIHTLLYGDQVTGVTLMKIHPDKFDVGEIISQKRVNVPDDILLPELTEQLSEYGANMLVDCLRTIPESLDNAQPQPNEGVTYARKINKNISDVRWSGMTATEVFNLYRSIYGLYPLTTHFKDKQIKLFGAFKDSQSKLYEGTPGTIHYCKNTSSIKVVCKGNQCISFKNLRIVGKRKITALDFYNGYLKNNQNHSKCIFY